MIDKDKFFQRLGVTGGEWKSTVAHNFSGTFVALINANESCLFMTRHDNGKHTKGQSENDAKMAAASKEMFWDMLWFCLRVEEGSVRSRRTYAQFKETLINAIGKRKTWEEIKAIAKECEE